MTNDNPSDELSSGLLRRNLRITPGRSVATVLALVGSLCLAACGERMAESPAGPAAESPATSAAESPDKSSAGSPTGSPAASPQSADSLPVPRYSARTFYETTSYDLVPPKGRAFSSDGDSLLISSDETGVYNAWVLPLDGTPPQPLTGSNDDAVFALSWFPDDDRILYTADNGGDELNHVFVREADGRVRDLTPGDALRALFLKWSADGESFFILSTERDQQNFDLYRYSAADYERELLYENTGFEIADLSPDGRWLALDRPRTSADSDIYLVDLSGEQQTPVLITEHTGNIAHGTFAFTPDSRYLVYGTDEHGEFMQAWQYDLQDGARSRLIEAPWDVSYVDYSSSGRYRVSAINADATTRLTLHDTRAGTDMDLPPLPQGDQRSVRFSADESAFALIVDAGDSPPNVHFVDIVRGTSRQLTQALNPEIDPSHLVRGEVIRYRSFDGLEIPSIQYRPHGASAQQPAPALVWVHGGPGGQSGTGYSAAIQHLVNHGFAVLAANNRGSSGYGKTFFHMDDRRHGEEDLGDIVHARTYLASQDWIDGSRVGVIGQSYGGFLATAALAFEPQAFDVGIDIFGVTNWVRTLQNIPPWWASFREALYDEMGDPATDAERHRRVSPLFHAEQIAKPMLVVQGANDPRVLQVESDELVAAVRTNGVPVDYLVFSDEGHGFRKRENRIAASEAYVRFLDQYLRAERSEP